ncbi:hypothetical protein OTU49_009867 [Cherax quadricarinatus]|uniref:C-type lectin domain-containing protein n=1 Tax=Cherax quadricarinatus TaxID=27406 RepID=A0AAW0W976_CHEQU
MLRISVLLAVLVGVAVAQRQLIRPDPQACKNRIKHATTFRNGHYYFFSCDRPDLQPPIVNGWFWSGSSARISPTNSTSGWRGGWSRTGGSGRPQPDNREFTETRTDESCIAILNNFYNDGIVWHDVACHHVKPWVCEDSEELLRFARFTYPEAQIP